MNAYNKLITDQIASKFDYIVSQSIWLRVVFFEIRMIFTALNIIELNSLKIESGTRANKNYLRGINIQLLKSFHNLLRISSYVSCTVIVY